MPPVERPIATTDPEKLKEYCRVELERCARLLDEIVARESSDGARGTLDRLNELGMTVRSAGNHVGLLRSVHPAGAVREAAESCEQDVAQFASSLMLNRDLYNAVCACEGQVEEKDEKRLVEHLQRDFRRDGVDRDEKTRARIRSLREELVALGQEFTRNIVDDVRTVRMPRDEGMAGLPDDYVRDHPVGDDGKVAVTTNHPDYAPYMLYARSSRWREELYKTLRLRAYPANLDVLDRILARRHALATILGFPSWAAYATDDKMIRTAEAIGEFVDRVAEIAEKRGREDYHKLLTEKRRDDPEAEVVHDWEKVFYEERVKNREFQVDSKEIRQYFEYGRVRDGILALSEDLFGVEFCEVPDAPRWHEAVQVMDIVEGERQVGRVYLDMHPREGKFKHAAMFPLGSGVRDLCVPEAALVCNFPDPQRSGGGPALLEHDDVVTFFHEFGHLLHHILGGNQRWVEFSGIATEWDFVEVPSQLYEEWGWDIDVLRRFAVHHESGETIPDRLVERMRRARDFGQGLWVRHQMFYAALAPRMLFRRSREARYDGEDSRAPESLQLLSVRRRDFLSGEFRPPRRLLGSLLHVHVVARHRERPLPRVQEERYSLDRDRPSLSADDSGAGRITRRQGFDQRLSGTRVHIRGVRGLVDVQCVTRDRVKAKARRVERLPRVTAAARLVARRLLG